MKYGMFDTNGELVQYVHADDLSDIELRLGYTLRDAENTVIDFDDPWDALIMRARRYASKGRENMDKLLAALDEMEELRD